MTHANIDPAKQAAPLKRGPDSEDRDECMMSPSGPAGVTTFIEHDEKAILDSGVLAITMKTSSGYMRSDHDSHKQGIYRTNSVGDYD